MSDDIDDIPVGTSGFLYVGCCNDTCGAPYGPEDTRVGHECCSTVAAEVVRLRALVRDLVVHVSPADIRDVAAWHTACGPECPVRRAQSLILAP